MSEWQDLLFHFYAQIYPPAPTIKAVTFGLHAHLSITSPGVVAFSVEDHRGLLDSTSVSEAFGSSNKSGLAVTRSSDIHVKFQQKH